jgi:peptide deformylase
MKLRTCKLPILNAFNKDQLMMLKRANTEIGKITPPIKALIRNMHFTLDKSNNGVGLAAPQVGINVRLFIIHYQGSRMTVINPTILYFNDTINVEVEGCLSVPNVGVLMPRSEIIRASFTNAIGERIVDCVLHGFLARIFQHEYDHLEGKLISNFSTEDGIII